VEEDSTQRVTFANIARGDALLTGTLSGCALRLPPAPVRRIVQLLPERQFWKLFLNTQRRRAEYLRPATQSRRAFSAPTARSTSANRRSPSSPRPDPARGRITRPAPLDGAAFARLSFASVVAACCFPIPIAPNTAPKAGCATAPLRRPSPRGEHLQHDADHGLHCEIHREVCGRKVLEHARALLPSGGGEAVGWRLIVRMRWSVVAASS
jgi:hypothetical protein